MIFITGDTHGHIDIHKLNMKNFPLQAELTKDDYLIVCGDFGLVWGGSNTKSDAYWQKWLNDKPFTTLFVDGNHENQELLQQYPVTEWHGGKVHMIQPGIIHLMRGQVYEIECATFFTMGGASSHDKEWRKEGVSWWPQELPSEKECEEAERNLASVGWKVDVVLTHCAPTSLQSLVKPGYKQDALTHFLDEINDRLQFGKWYIGHYHINKNMGNYRFIFEDILEYSPARQNKERKML